MAIMKKFISVVILLFGITAVPALASADELSSCAAGSGLSRTALVKTRKILRYMIHDSEYVAGLAWRKQMTYLKFCQLAERTGHLFAVSQDVGYLLERARLPVDGRAFLKTCAIVFNQPSRDFESQFVSVIARAWR